MANSLMQIVSDGSLSTIPLTIKFFEQSHIKVFVNNVELPDGIYTFAWTGATTLTITPAVAAGAEVSVRRKTPADAVLHDFQAGAVFSETSIDENFRQDLFLLQEASEQSFVTDLFDDLDMHGHKVRNLLPGTAQSDAVNVAQLEAMASSGGTSILRTELLSSTGADIVRFAPAGGSLRSLGAAVLDTPDIAWFGATYTGSTSDANTLHAALTLTQHAVKVSRPCIFNMTTVQALAVIVGLNRINFEAAVTINLPAGEFNIPSRLYLSNTSLCNLTIRGAVPTVEPVVGCSVSGTAPNFEIELALTSSTSMVIGDYAIVGDTAGTGFHRAIAGCWRVTAIGSSSVTFKVPWFVAPPAFTITSANIRPIRTVLRWPVGVVGLAITAYLKELSNVILTGSYDVTTSALADGPADGLQIGSSPNTPETGLNESEQGNFGSVYLANVGIVEWQANGTQVFGRLVAVNCAVCSNGWRGWQAGRSGSIIAKRSSGSCNGASGYEAEEGGFVLAHNSAMFGNKEQGVFAIGGGATVDIAGSQVGANQRGLDSRNFATVLADTTQVSGDSLGSLYANAGNILFGSSASCTGTVVCTEAGVIDALGASALGAVTINAYDGSRVIMAGGVSYGSDVLRLKRQDGAEVVSAVTSTGDLAVALGAGTITYKTDGSIYLPDGAFIGRAANAMAYIVLKSPGGSAFKVAVDNAGVLVTTAL